MQYDIDEFLRHQQYIERLASGGVNSTITPMLGRMYRGVSSVLGNSIETPTQAQLNKIINAINKAIDENNIWSEFTADKLEPLAEYEATWQANYQVMSGVAAVAPKSNEIQSFISQAMMSLTSGSRTSVAPWSDYVTANVDSQKRYIDAAVRTGFNSGNSISQIKKSVKALTDGIIAKEADTLARTGYIHYAAQANEAMIQANDDILNEYYYLVTFDSRTSNTCIGIDAKYNPKGKRFKVGDKRAPVPPMHFNCRTRRIGIAKGATLTGTRAAVGGQSGAVAKELFEGKKDRLRTKSQVTYTGKKDLEIFKPEQVKANQSYGTWLKQQPTWYIQDTLGLTRAKLFMDGGLDLSSITDASGKTLTLAQLRARDNAAFVKAGFG